jgi:hypothetical protein
MIGNDFRKIGFDGSYYKATYYESYPPPIITTANAYYDCDNNFDVIYYFNEELYVGNQVFTDPACTELYTNKIFSTSPLTPTLNVCYETDDNGVIISDFTLKIC